MNKRQESDLEDFREGKPYIRTALAFLLRLKNYDFREAYQEADRFIDQLEKDITEFSE